MTGLRRSGPAVVVLALAVLMLGPVLASSGYVLVGDMTFVPDQPWKGAWLGLDGSVPRAVPADAVVAVVSGILPGDVLQKLVLVGIPALAGLGMLRLTARLNGLTSPARLGGAVLYQWNPFVFERLAIGHWGLLVGYAALPWVAAAALDVRRGPGAMAPRALGRLVLLLAVAATGSPTGGLVAGLVALVLAADRRHRGRLAVVAATVLVVNLPWLTPALVNDLGSSDGSGVAAFAARADTPLGTAVSLLTFGGIWKGAVAPGERGAAVLVLSALVVVVLSLVVLAGSARRSHLRVVLAPARLLALALAALLLAGLPAGGPGQRFATAVVDAVPGAGLWRDSQKWLVPFVLVTCLGFTMLLEAVGRRMSRAGVPAASATVVLALLPVVLLPSLAWGLSGRLAPVHYPDEWSAVRSILESEPAAERRIAVLPWSAYQRLPWNDRRAALDPAIRFFPGQVVVSEDLGVGDGLTVEGEDPTATRIGRAVAAHEPLGPALEAAGVRYLLVERTAPSAVRTALPPGRVLHEGRELLLLDLGTEGRPTRSPHVAVIVIADAVAVLVVLLGAVLLIRRKPDAVSGSMHGGSSINGGGAVDYR